MNFAGTQVCRKMGISENTFYRWKRKYEGFGVAEIRRLRQLEEENRKLKQLVADLSLDKEMLQDVIRKNSEACPEARGGRVPVPLLQGLRAKSLLCDPLLTHKPPVPQPSARAGCPEETDQRVGRGSRQLRLQADPHPAAERGLEG